MTPPGSNPYASQAVATATPAQLILMLYDGALTALGKVRRAHEDGSPQAMTVMNRELQRTQDIVNELNVCLNHDDGQPIAGNLAKLYEYCQHLLVRMNISKSIDKIEDVEQIISELRDGWNDACVKGVGAQPVAVAS